MWRVAVLLAWLGAAPVGRAFEAIYAFGDSLTDTGNNPAPATGYYQGRYSNGPLWIEYLSTQLGLAYEPTRNFAQSGGETTNALIQVQQFAAPTNADRALFVVWAGGNDFIHNFSKGLDDGFWNALIFQSVGNLSNAVSQLYADGARTIVVPNQVDLSRIPLALDSGYPSFALSYLRGKVDQFNTSLASALSAIGQARPDLHLIPLDVHAPFNALLTNLTSYGFTKADPDALTDSLLTDKSFDGPGKDYVFWDPIHPTTKAHAIVAQWFYQALPPVEPPLERLSVGLVGGSLQLSLANLRSGQVYTLQSSSNLVDWGEATTISATNSVQQWTTALGSAAQSFYRLTW